MVGVAFLITNPAQQAMKNLTLTSMHPSLATGLFGVIIPAFLYSIFGTCNQLNVGPEAALSLL